MFSHLKRNWLIQNVATAATSSPRSKSKRGADSDTLFPKKRAKLDNAEKVKITLGQNVKKSIVKSGKDLPKSLPYVSGKRSERPKAVKRLVLKRKSVPRVPYYDETDKKALKVINLLNVIQFFFANTYRQKEIQFFLI
jgi:hypothetical protein